VRVLHVTPYFPPATQYGGPPASVLGLCQALQRVGVDVEVVTTTANGQASLPASPPDGDVFDGVPVRYAPAAFPRRLFGARLGRPLTTAMARADVCHIHGIWNVPEWRAALAARAAGVPYVVSPRGMLQPQAIARGRGRKAIAYRMLEQRNLHGAAFLHATSAFEADAIRALRLDVPIVVAPNGVDVATARRASSGFRRRLGIPADAFVIVFLGRFHRIKRIDLLVDAFVDLRRTHQSARLVIAGPDEQGLAAELRARAGADAPALHEIGPVHGDAKWALLRDADATVTCSDSESFGLSVVEALAAATPVVVTKTCPWSQIESRGCGFWVDQTPAAIAGALRILADDPSRRRLMGDAGAAFAAAAYGWDAIAQTLRCAYEGIASPRSAPMTLSAGQGVVAK
jgi:glycosyltransferase involved in cell wall biosynthesis